MMYILNKVKKTHDDVINELVKTFNHDETVKLRFESQDWYWNAYVIGPFEFDKDVGMQAELTLKVHVLDPYKYAVEGTKTQLYQTKSVWLVQELQIVQ